MVQRLLAFGSTATLPEIFDLIYHHAHASRPGPTVKVDMLSYNSSFRYAVPIRTLIQTYASCFTYARAQIHAIMSYIFSHQPMTLESRAMRFLTTADSSHIATCC